MTHGIYFSNTIKHHEIIKFDTIYKVPKHRKNADFKANYHFVWEIYKHVADLHGIEIPYRWVSVEKLTRRHRYVTYRKNAIIMEPLGPTIIVNHSFSLSGLLNTGAPRGAVMADQNWYKMAEHYFMVGAGANKPTNKYAHRYRVGVMCEKFRAIRLTPPK
jgi:hypothetical protein